MFRLAPHYNPLPLSAALLVLTVLPARLPAQADPRLLDLGALLTDPKANATKRVRAAQQLGALGEKARPAARKLCLAMLDRSAQVRKAAAVALEKVHPNLAPHCITLTADSDGERHTAALQAILKLGTDANAAVPIVLNHLKYQAEGLRNLLDLNPFQARVSLVASLIALDAKVLSHIAPDEPGIANRVAALTLESDLPAEVRLAGVEALGQFGASAVEQINRLRRLRTADPEQAVREAAANALARIEGETKRRKDR